MTSVWPDAAACSSEAEVYAVLGLSYLEPELRADRGEIESARNDRQPALVCLGDLRGDLHAHTLASDGPRSRGTGGGRARARVQVPGDHDHSTHAAVHGGLDAKGVEVEILEDGRLDLPDANLRRLDLVLGGIHHRYTASREKQTSRMLKAMDGPHPDILAHPSAG